MGSRKFSQSAAKKRRFHKTASFPISNKPTGKKKRLLAKCKDESLYMFAFLGIFSLVDKYFKGDMVLSLFCLVYGTI
jgi:hypothetical protein